MMVKRYPIATFDCSQRLLGMMYLKMDMYLSMSSFENFIPVPIVKLETSMGASWSMTMSLMISMAMSSAIVV
jgi:hypothetical protein